MTIAGTGAVSGSQRKGFYQPPSPSDGAGALPLPISVSCTRKPTLTARSRPESPRATVARV